MKKKLVAAKSSIPISVWSHGGHFILPHYRKNSIEDFRKMILLRRSSPNLPVANSRRQDKWTSDPKPLSLSPQ